jgi:hypothetical protein
MAAELNLLPCPFCGVQLEGEIDDGASFHTHPEGECMFSGWEFDQLNLSRWNRRAAPSASVAPSNEAPCASDELPPPDYTQNVMGGDNIDYYTADKVRAILAADRRARQGEPLMMQRYSIDCDGLPFTDSEGVWIAYSDYAATKAAAPAGDAREQSQQEHVMPPTRGTGSQHKVTRLDLLSLIRTQIHRAYASAIDREEIDSKYMDEIEEALRAVYAEAELASRFRAQGGITSAEGSVINYGSHGDNDRCRAAGSEKAQADTGIPTAAEVEKVDLTPNWAGEFKSYEQWVAKGRSWLKSESHRPPICVDAKGRRCSIGADMARARDEGTFPVRYFWDCEAAPSHPSEAKAGEDA